MRNLPAVPAVKWSTSSIISRQSGTCSRPRADLELPGLGVSCAYAKLLARVADFIDTDETRDRALKLSLGKRSLSDLNELTGELSRLAGIQHSLREMLELHIELLAHVREQLIDLLTRLRTLRAN